MRAEWCKRNDAREGQRERETERAQRIAITSEYKVRLLNHTLTILRGFPFFSFCIKHFQNTGAQARIIR